MKKLGVLFLVGLFELGFVSSLTAQPERTIDSCRKVIKGNFSDTAKIDADLEISLMYRQLGEIDSALASAERSRLFAISVGSRNREAKSMYYLGIAHSIVGDYAESLKLFEGSAEILEELGDLQFYSSLLTAIGSIKNILGDPSGALDYHLKSLAIKEKLGDSVSMASTMTNIGNVYNAINRPDTALQYFQMAMRIHRQYNMLTKLDDDLYNVGNTYGQMGEDSLALVYLKESVVLADSLGLIEILSYSYGSIATCYFEMGSNDSALLYYRKALEVAEQVEDKRMIAVEYHRIGKVYMVTGPVDTAESYLLRSLALSTEIHDLENLDDVHKALSELYRTTGDFEKALYHFEQHILARDSIIDSDKQTEIARKVMQADFDKTQAVEAAKQEEEKRQKNIVIGLVTAVLGLVLVAILFLYNRFVVMRKQKSIIQAQKEQTEIQKELIQEKNRSITDSINYAQRIQQAMLPDWSTIRNIYPESFVLFHPKDIVSGDFYWTAESRDYIFYATADCTGHGVPGGFMSVLGASLLNEIINEKKIQEPGEILDLLRIKIILSLKQTGKSGENRDGMDMVLCRIDRGGQNLVFSAANNPLWLCRNGVIIEYKGDKQPVGIGVENPAQFNETRIGLLPGDMIYTFTDGYADQFGGPNGKKFRYKPFREILEKNSSLGAAQQHDILLREFTAWQGSEEQVDDVLVIGIRV